MSDYRDANRDFTNEPGAPRGHWRNRPGRRCCRCSRGALAGQWVLWWVAWQVPLLAGWPARRLPGGEPHRRRRLLA